MTRHWLGIAVFAFALSAKDAWARPSFESLWAEVTGEAGCAPQDYADFILVTCKAELTLWYFTKPNHPAYPGVIKRMIEEKNGAFFAHEEGYSFAPDSAQAAFKAWLAQIADLDRQMREYIEKQHGQKSDDTPN